ncbi:type IV pilin protein [Clostridium disporicum]|uniref:Serogroup A1 n=1 Tax=Clostridium disporicum TaxID=84024 RepID=A0A174HRD7_9CLOT|nr:prepilin-type N-terminal cleavage/methylation domain-containing protein [Clostridium disporicum]CUO75678.1 Serogroup A1 [Clostridium disporicum]
MIIKKYKKGFTLIELMAVVSIVVILLAITTAIINGYVDRANKVNVITQSRDVIQYSISSNIEIGSDIKLGNLVNNNVFSDYEGRLDYLQDDISINTLLAISADQDALNKIKLKDRKIVEWTGENSYKKSDD